MRLFLRLTEEVNNLLRDAMRYRGDLSRQVEEALISTDLATVELPVSGRGRAVRGLTAMISGRANARLRTAARQRDCSVTTLANSALHRWLGGKRS